MYLKLDQDAKLTEIIQDVTKFGGKIGEKLNFSLKWWNGNDLDLHV